MENRKIFTEEEILAIARQVYDHGEAKIEVQRSRCALLVIDMQDEFIKPGWTPYWAPEATRAVPRIRSLIDTCRKLDVPVIYTVFERTHRYMDRPFSGKFMPNRYPIPEGSNDQYFVKAHIVDELAPREDEIVISKPSYGAFYDTPLESILKNLGKDTVIISGTMTNFCCGTTARQAYERGFQVIFGSDINGTDDPEMQEPELKVLRKGFARVMTGEEIQAALRA